MIDLQEEIKKCEELTGVKCTIPVEINNRLTTTLGWTTFYGITKDEIHDIKIELSGKLMKYGKDEDIISTIRHEYAHYCTTLTCGNHNHDNEQFKIYCKMLHTTPDPSVDIKLPYKYDVICTKCGKANGHYDRINKLIKRKGEGYRSGCCGAKLKVIQNY